MRNCFCFILGKNILKIWDLFYWIKSVAYISFVEELCMFLLSITYFKQNDKIKIWYSFKLFTKFKLFPVIYNSHFIPNSLVTHEVVGSTSKIK